MNYSLTVFDSIFDNTTNKRMDFENFVDLEKVLYSLSKKPGYKAKRGERKQSSSLISPAIYTPGATRANANVTAWAGWCALDIDNYTGRISDIINQYKRYYFVCYSTASSTKEKPKFRLVLPLKRHIPAEKIRHFWYALSKEFNSMGDEQTKDLSRMYYVPAQYPNAYNFIFTTPGMVLDPDVLMSDYPYSEKISSTNFIDRLPDHIQKELLQMKKEGMTRGDISWSSYRDCPFVNKKLIKEYSNIAHTDGSGRYRMIYKIMTSIACQAVKRKYPITAIEIADIVGQLDRETSRIYQKRNLKMEADRALEFAYKHAL